MPTLEHNSSDVLVVDGPSLLEIYNNSGPGAHNTAQYYWQDETIGGTHGPKTPEVRTCAPAHLSRWLLENLETIRVEDLPS